MTGTHDTPRSVAQAIDAGFSAPPTPPEDISFLRLPDVITATGLSKSSIYSLVRANSFPAPVQLGPRTVGWVRSEVQKWAAERIEDRRALQAGVVQKLA
jgi:prophage regulatory protein